MKLFAAIFAIVAVMLGSLVAAQAQIVGPSTFSFTAGSQSNTWNCTSGQSTFQLTMPTGMTGVLTVTVAQTSGGTYVNPPWAYAPGVPTYANTLTNSGSLTVILGSNYYVKVADTTYSSGSVTVTGSCSNGVSAIPPQATNSPLPVPVSVLNGGTGTSSPNPVVTATACAASPAWSNAFPSGTLQVPAGCATPSATNSPLPVPVTVANGGTGTASPNPTVTATACAASPAWSNAFPSGTLQIPSGCATPSATNSPLPVPVTVANGGTGTSSPNPSATATACGAAVADTGSFPSQVVNVPVCPTASPGPSLPLSVANGGTATAQPSPAATATACGAAPAYTGTWPSQTLDVPICATSTGITSIGAGNDIVVTGAAPSPSVAVTNQPTFSGSLAVDGASAPTNGYGGGVAGSTALTFTATTNSTTTTGFVFNTSTACHLATDTLFNVKVNSTTKFSATCGGAIAGLGYIEAGSGNSPSSSVAAGDLSGSESSTQGELWLGGSSKVYTQDLGVTTASTATYNIPSGDTYAWDINSSKVLGLSSTTLTASTGLINMGTANAQMEFAAGTMSWAVPSSDNYAWNVNLTQVASLSSAGVFATSAQIESAALSNSTTTQGYLMPTYTHTGVASNSTVHCIVDTVVAGGASTTITLTAATAAIFSTGVSMATANDVTTGATSTVTGVSGNSMLISPTVNGQTYAYQMCGY